MGERPEPMQLVQPLRHRLVALLRGGLALSAIGDQAYNVAFAWIATEAFGGNAGFLVAVGPLASLVTLAFAGLLAALVAAPALLTVVPLAEVIELCGVAILGIGVVGLGRFGVAS